MGHVHGDELHVAVHQVGDEHHIAREPIQLGDEKHGAALPAFGYCREQLGPIGVLLAAFDLDELRDDTSTGLDISTDGFPLRLHTEAGDALLVSRDAKVTAEIVKHRLREGESCRANSVRLGRLQRKEVSDQT
jgi:hypothetical protein